MFPHRISTSILFHPFYLYIQSNYNLQFGTILIHLQTYQCKGTFVPMLKQTLRHEDEWGSGCIDPRIPDLDIISG
jgi:hypothetical protein